MNTYEEIEVATIAIDKPSKNEIEADRRLSIPIRRFAAFTGGTTEILCNLSPNTDVNGEY